VGYLGYYFAWLALSYTVRQPWLLVGLVVLWLLRGVVPAPGALFGALSGAGRLREQVRLNRANVTARRDLATVYLELLRPRRALELLEEGLALSPDDAELLYLSGLALQRIGQHERALERLLRAIEKDSRLRHGRPYFVAGEALLSLQRWDDAVDAFERYLDYASSDVAAHTALARAYAGARDAAAARKWLRAGLETWHGLPGSMKRRQLAAYLRAQWARVAVLRQPGAVVAALSLAVLAGYGARAAWPLAAGLWQPNDARSQLLRMREAAKRCGTQQTGEFEGEYRASLSEQEDEVGYDLRIGRDRITWQDEDHGTEYCLSKVIERRGGSLHAEAILRFVSARERDEAAAGMSTSPGGVLFDVRLDRGRQFTRLRLAPVGEPMAATVLDLRRKQ